MNVSANKEWNISLFFSQAFSSSDSANPEKFSRIWVSHTFHLLNMSDENVRIIELQRNYELGDLPNVCDNG
jgi:hypothetical protein